MHEERSGKREEEMWSQIYNEARRKEGWGNKKMYRRKDRQQARENVKEEKQRAKAADRG